MWHLVCKVILLSVLALIENESNFVSARHVDQQESRRVILLAFILFSTLFPFKIRMVKKTTKQQTKLI